MEMKVNTNKRFLIDELKGDLKSCDLLCEGFSLELKNQSQSDKRIYKQKLTIHVKKINELKSKLEWQESDEVRVQLLDRKDVVVDLSTPSAQIQRGQALDADITASLQRSIGTGVATLEIAKPTLIQLQQQEEQMIRMNDDLDEIDARLNHSSKIIRNIGRSIMTDKLIWFLAFMVFVAIGLIIYWRVGRGAEVSDGADKLVNRN
jgi:hypothetical protein